MPDRDPNDWSDFIDETFNKRPTNGTGAPPPLILNGGPIDSTSRDRAYALAGLQRESMELAAMLPDTGRNMKLNNAVFSLAGFVPQTLSQEEVIDSLTAAARTSGLPDGEINATIRSAFTASKQQGNVRTAPPREEATDWFAAVAASAAAGVPQTVEGPGAITANGRASAGVDDDDSSSGAPTLEQIESDFWSARPELELIYTAALARMASPWAVLACCVARTLCLVPPAITLPPIIGDKGSLNWFAAIAAKSGGGKGAAMSVARQLVAGDVLVRPIGSGEGMIECYDRAPRKAKDDNPPDPIVSILFDVAEVDSLGAIGNRTGQTTLAILRQGFSGETLGYSYRGRQSEQVIEHTYRMSLLVAVQPLRAGILLDDGGGGIPQRFMWFPARDKRITADVPEWPVDDLGRRRVVPSIGTMDIMRAAGTVNVPREIWTEIREARAASMRGDDNALDTHALFSREKLAYALAFMNGRTTIELEDWRLAGIAASVSDWMREKVIRDYQAGQEEEARQRGRLKGVEGAASEVGKSRESMDGPSRVVRKVVAAIAQAGPTGISNRDLRNNKLRSTERDLFSGALDYLMRQGTIRQLEGTTRWVLC